MMTIKEEAIYIEEKLKCAIAASIKDGVNVNPSNAYRARAINVGNNLYWDYERRYAVRAGIPPKLGSLYGLDCILIGRKISASPQYQSQASSIKAALLISNDHILPAIEYGFQGYSYAEYIDSHASSYGKLEADLFFTVGKQLYNYICR